MYALAFFGLAKLLNSFVFGRKPASKITCWVLSGLVFFFSGLLFPISQILSLHLVNEIFGTNYRYSGNAGSAGPGSLLATVVFFLTISRRFKSNFFKSVFSFSLITKSRTADNFAATSSPVSDPERLPEDKTGRAVLPSSTVEQESKLGLAEPTHRAWELALLEFDGPERRAGLWAQIFAAHGGGENSSKAEYLKVRAKEIQLVLFEAEAVQLAENIKVTKPRQSSD
jgi:hypothetical protein